MIEVLDMRLIDKISAATTKDQLFDSSLAMARSEKVRETNVASRKLSSLPLKGHATGNKIEIIESKSIKLNDPIQLSVLSALKAAFCSVKDGTIKRSTVSFL